MPNSIRNILAPISLILITVTLWLPFGFRSTGLVEEWDLMQLGDSGANLFWLDASAPHLSEYRIRPLLSAFFGIARLIDTDSFLGLNLVIIALIAGKAILIYALMRRLMPTHGSLAWLAAVFAILYPSAQGLTPRAFGVHGVLFFYLLAVYLLTEYWQSRRWLILAAAILAQTVAILIYETIDPLMLIAPLLLIWLDQRISKRVLIVSAVWLIMPLLLGIRLLLILNDATTYHSAMLGAANFDPQNAPLVLAGVYGDLFRWGWLSALIHERFTAAYLGWGMLIAVMGAVIYVLHLSNEGQPIPLRRMIPLLLIALLAVGAGFLIYAFFVVQRGRTALYYPLAGLGAAISLAIVLDVLARLRWLGKPAALVIASALISLAAMDALWQHDRYVTLSRHQQDILRGVIELAPDVAEGTCIVLIDQGNTTHFTEVFLEPRDLGTALSVVYDDPSVRGFVCHLGIDCRMPEDEVIGALQSDPMTCANNENLLFTYLHDGRVSIFPRAGSTITGSHPPPRAVLMLEGTAQFPHDAVRLEFDGAELIKGNGWHSPEITVDGITHRWMSDETALLNFYLFEGRDYHLTFRVIFEISQPIHESLRLEVNGFPTLLTRASLDPIYEADFHAPIRGMSIVLIVDEVVSPADLGLSADDRAVGLALDWLEITALTP